MTDHIAIPRRLVAAAALATALMGAQAEAAEPIIFGTDWKAQAEHGGFYQAAADGTYARYGLDVSIRPGGPQVNHSQLLAAGKVDFNIGGGNFIQLNFTQAQIPVVTVAAIFQKSPIVLMAHPGQGVATPADLRGRTLIVSNEGRLTYWRWLVANFGLEEKQLKPYTFNPAPFLADPSAVQQGFVTSEPWAIRSRGGFEPVVLLLADHGYDPYSTIIQTTSKLVEERPETVQRFINATIEGWYNYLYGDNAAANRLIRSDNPEMTDDQLAYSLDAMKRYGIVDSGDSLRSGIGAMSKDRWDTFLAKAVSWGLYPAELPVDRAYTTRFVNQGHGLELRKQLGAP